MTTKNQLILALFLIGQCALFANSNPTNSSLVRDCTAFNEALQRRIAIPQTNLGGCNPGISPGEVLICENGMVCLFELLEGDPTPDGIWTGPPEWIASGAPGCVGQFDPTTDPPGDYTYTVFGEGGVFCSATITMEYSDLGIIDTYVYCSPDTLDLYSLLFDNSGAQAQYCDVDDGGNTSDDWLAGVEFAGIDNTSGSTVYTDYTGISGSVEVGVTYPFTATIGNGGSWNQYVTVYIDWNQDEVFNETDERFDLGNCTSNGCTVTGDILVPTAPPGETRMRVIENYNGYTLSACAPGYYSETEDYTIFNSLDTTALSGVWFYPNGNIVPNGVLDPADENAVPGNYAFEFYNANTCFTTGQVNILFSTVEAGGLETWADICTTSETFSPFDLLEGNPASGGAWVAYNENGEFLNFWPFHNTVFYVDDFQSGDYFTYVLGAPPCTPTYTDLHINIINAAITGIATTAAICQNSPPIDLPILLDGNPDPGLNWTLLGVDPPGEPSTISNPFDPSLYPPNTTLQLLYSWEDPTGQCASSTLLTLNILPATPSAGTSTIFTYCADTPPVPFDMAAYVLPESEEGEWRDPNWDLHNNFFDPEIDEPGRYYYYIPNGICGTDLAYIEIIATPALSAASDSTLSLCTLDGAVMLDTLLMGTAAPGGQWIGPDGSLIENIIQTETALAGSYTYTLDEGACAGTGVITLNFDSPTTNAGPDITLPEFCGDGTTLNLMDYLDDTAVPGGYFYPTSNITLNSQNAGIYTYSVSSGNTCPSDNAAYTVNIIDQIAVTILQEICSPDGSEYFLIAGITGGEGSYSSPDPFTEIDANGLVAGPFQSGTAYSITISDSGSCPDLVLSNSGPNCECEGAYATMNTTGDDLCQGECATLLLYLQGQGPFDIVLNDGTTDYNFTSVSNTFTTTVCPEQTTTYSLVSVETPNCVGTPMNQQVTINGLPLNPAGPDTTLTICHSDWSIYTNFLLHPEASFPGSFNTSYISPENQVPQELIYITDIGDCPADTAVYDLSFYELLTYNLLEAHCNPDDPSTYTVTFEATGTPPFTADNGTFDGNLFTSELMSLADSAIYHIVLTDGNGCTKYFSGTIDDTDGDGICDEGEIVGCQNPDAPNYNPLATDPGPCQAGGFEDAPDVLSDVSTDEPGGGWGLVSQTGNDANHWDFSLFPNPWQSAAKLQIALRGLTDEKPVQLELHDLTGRLVWKQSMALQNGIEIYAITLPSDLDMGTYLFSVRAKDGERKSKVLMINR